MLYVGCCLFFGSKIRNYQQSYRQKKIMEFVKSFQDHVLHEAFLMRICYCTVALSVSLLS